MSGNVRERIAYNSTCPEDGDQYLIYSNSEEKQEKSIGAHCIDSGESGSRILAKAYEFLPPKGEPKDWTDKDWAQEWARLYTKRHQAPLERGMFGHAILSVEIFFNNHQHDVTPGVDPAMRSCA